MFSPIAVVAGIAGAIGLTKLLFGLHGLAASTILAPSLGPVPIVLLTTLDSLVGAVLCSGGVGVLARKEWARKLLVHGSLLIVGYEVGRAVGLAAAWREYQDLYSVLLSIAFIVVLIIVVISARSPQSEAYVRPH